MPQVFRVVQRDPLGFEEVHDGGSWALGRFVRRPGHRQWAVENAIGPNPVLVFPRRAVRIAQRGHRVVVASPSVAVLYAARTPYHRALIDPRGDDCDLVVLPTATWDAIVDHHDPDRAGLGTFRHPCAPIRPEVRLEFERLRRAIGAGELGGLGAEEALIRLASNLFAAGLDRSPPGDPRHRDLAVALEEVLAARFRLDDSLADLAGLVGLSPFHAARLFRRHTGQSMHAYRDRLRLLASLEEIASGERLDTVALGLGFASHAHYSDRFRRAFGVSPSVVRRDLASTILKAPVRARP